jgi:alanine racemase
MKPKKSYSTWVEINLNAIRDNVKLLRELTNISVMAVVKANGYGHGLVPTAKAAVEGGASWLGVARIEEAQALREGGIENPTLVMGFMPEDRIKSAIQQDISLTIWSGEQVKEVSTTALDLGKKAKIHLKVDTGMSRLGVQCDEALALAEQITHQDSIIFEGIFTHFALADEEDQTPTDKQEEAFRITLDALSKHDLLPPIVHAANSAASISRPSAYFNLVRPGIAIYGLHPSKSVPLSDKFRPAMVWKTVLSHVKTLPPGRGISYGHEYITHTEERIGTLPIGYADGFRRVPGNQVLIGGKRVPVVGRVCMDQISVQLDAVPNAKVGQEVVIIGSQGDQWITAEEIAERWGTINYEVVCGVGARVPRIYL